MFKNRKKDENITIYDENDSIQKSRQKSRRVFVFYIIALFCVALVIILASYVVQANQRRALEDIGKQLNEQTDVAEGAQNRAERMQSQLEELQTQVSELQKKLDEANGDLDAQKDANEQLGRSLKKAQQSSEAMGYLWQLEKAYYENDYDTAISLIEKMDKKYGRENLTKVTEQPLTNDAAKEYNSICEALGA